MEHHMEKRFHNLTLDQVQALDKVLTEVIPIHGRGNFPTLQVRAKDMIRVVKDRLVERDIRVKDIRLNGASASHVLVRDNGLGYRDLDIIFGVELPRQEDLQVIKEVVLGSLRELLPCGVNRRKITCLTMKEAYVQKMVKVFNEHDRWSLISLSNNRAKTVGLRFVSSLRRQFEFSVDSFQIILDRMLESYWETERKQGGEVLSVLSKGDRVEQGSRPEQTSVRQDAEANVEKKSAACRESLGQDQAVSALEKEFPCAQAEHAVGKQEASEVLELKRVNLQQGGEEVEEIENVHSKEDIVFELCEQSDQKKEEICGDYPLVPSPKSPDARDPLTTKSCLKLRNNGEKSVSEASKPEKPTPQNEETREELIDSATCRSDEASAQQDSQHEFSFPPPAKKTCSASQDVVPGYCPLPKLQRKMSRKLISKPEKWSLLSELSDFTAQLFPPIEIPKAGPEPRSTEAPAVRHSDAPKTDTCDLVGVPTRVPAASCESAEQSVKPKHSKKPPDLSAQVHMCAGGAPAAAPPPPTIEQRSDGAAGAAEKQQEEEEPTSRVVVVEAECTYGDFEQALGHLRHRLIATRSPEEIRGGGLLKYSDLLVRNFRPASETEIKSLERYMCSRFFIDFPDVGEQQRKIEAYLQCHFAGSEEAGRYDYLMTLRRVIDESTVCLMGHERRQTLNMITVLALRVLGEQNAIPNAANITCFYQPAPYVSEPIYGSYFVGQAQPPLVYHPYPLHVHVQTGLV
ncbi:terminal nucleotidyltransferase 5C-like [Nelusetta ayraudi]|uniref:terminal nucleotidyltransferase 5C-like n=1 Tax=Nelusetta ayraudi TaxID=303726 RepID=UPI003F6FA5FB